MWCYLVYYRISYHHILYDLQAEKATDDFVIIESLRETYSFSYIANAGKTLIRRIICHVKLRFSLWNDFSSIAVRVPSPPQKVESHHLRDRIHEITVRSSAEQLDLTSSCMLYRSSHDFLSEEEEEEEEDLSESAMILERSPSQTVLRTLSQRERVGMKTSSVPGNQQGH